jgi:hypothetical protein
MKKNLEHSVAIQEEHELFPIVEDLIEKKKLWKTWHTMNADDKTMMRKKILDQIANRYERIHTYRRRLSFEYCEFKNGPVDPKYFIDTLIKMGMQNLLIGKSHEEIQEMSQCWYDLNIKIDNKPLLP